MSNTDNTRTAEILDTARKMIAGQTDQYLLDTLRHSLGTEHDANTRRVQTWLIAELEQRHPQLTEQLDMWAETWADPIPMTTQPEITLAYFAAQRLAEVITENGHKRIAITHLHDECDANMYIDFAVRAVFGEIEDHNRWISTCNAVAELYEQNHLDS